VTGDSFPVMEVHEQRELARQLAASSEVLDFDQALGIVQWRPAEAERLIRMKEEMAKGQEERDRARARRKRALIEDFG
jgi:hypothetical protein